MGCEGEGERWRRRQRSESDGVNEERWRICPICTIVYRINRTKFDQINSILLLTN